MMGLLSQGHHGTKLESSNCNIGMGRRRDVTLRADIRFSHGDTYRGLGEVFKGKKVLLFGLPGGKVCDKQSLPAYVSSIQSLKELGVQEVVCIRPESGAEIQKWSVDNKIDPKSLTVLGDPRGDWVKFIGVDIVGGQPAPHHRYAALFDDGILLRLCVEDHPAEFNKTKPERMVDIYKTYFCRT